MRSILMLLATLTAGVCHAQSLTARSLCDLVADAEASDGKSFTIRALYEPTFHGAFVTGAACRAVRANATLLHGYKASASTLRMLHDISRRGDETEIVFHAIFRVAHEEQCFGQNCEPFQVEIDNIGVCFWRPNSSSQFRLGPLSNWRRSRGSYYLGRDRCNDEFTRSRSLRKKSLPSWEALFEATDTIRFTSRTVMPTAVGCSPAHSDNAPSTSHPSSARSAPSAT